jgi:hypothetical protein
VIEAQTIIFGILFCAAIIGLYLSHRLYRILETRHPEKYEAMGKPSLITNNNISNNISFVKFLFKLEWREFDDLGLSKLSKFLLVFSVVYLVGLICVILAVPLGLAP